MKLVFTILSISFLLFSCSKETDKRFTIPEDYRSWKKPVNKVLDYPITGHGKGFRIMYANDIAYRAKTIRDKNGNNKVIMPPGSVIIKEIYKKRSDINKKKPVFTIMVKENSKDIDYGWAFYLKKPGKKLVKVKSKMCIGCHEAANERHPYFDKNSKGIFRDFIFVNFIKE